MRQPDSLPQDTTPPQSRAEAPGGHGDASDRPEPRRTPPHGGVSPDGTRVWPRPSRSAKWLVWGGTGLAAAALTAATVIAARHVIDLLPDGKPHPQDIPPREKPPRSRRPAPRQTLLQEVEANTASLTNSVENVMHTLTAAMAAFRSVAGQASGTARDFGDAAGLMRDIIDRKKPAPRRRQSRHGADMPDLRDDPLMHDPMDGPEPSGPADHDPRLHRL